MQPQMEMEERRGSLEVSLLRLVEDYNQNTHFIRENTEKSKKAALSATQRVSELLLDTVNGGVQVSFTNEKLIEDEIRALAVTVARYSKQTNQWLAASRSMNSILKFPVFDVLHICEMSSRGRPLFDLNEPPTEEEGEDDKLFGCESKRPVPFPNPQTSNAEWMRMLKVSGSLQCCCSGRRPLRNKRLLNEGANCCC